MTKKVKKTKKNGIADENSVDEKVKAVAEENVNVNEENIGTPSYDCLLYTSPSPRDLVISRMPSSA